MSDEGKPARGGATDLEAPAEGGPLPELDLEVVAATPRKTARGSTPARLVATPVEQGPAPARVPSSAPIPRDVGVLRMAESLSQRIEADRRRRRRQLAIGAMGASVGLLVARAVIGHSILLGSASLFGVFVDGTAIYGLLGGALELVELAAAGEGT
jgi:hypothetical protein